VSLLKAARRDDLEPREHESEKSILGGRIKLPDDPDQFRATLVEHLEELRSRIIRSLLIIVGCWVLGWYLEPVIFGWLSNLLQTNIEPVVGKDKFKIIFGNFTEPFMLKLQVSFLIGVILASPCVLYQLWGFVRPGLKPNERKPIERVAPFTFVLFAIGVLFCCLILGPCAAWFATYLADFQGAVLYQNPAQMISFSLKMMLAFGLGFQLPVIVYALGALNLLSAETLAKYWRHAAVVIFFFAAAFTPSNDPFSMLMMAVPMVILFMISVWAVKITQRRRKKVEDDTRAAAVE
jgi:sec-independent protein translocase protein TatC